jgi:HEAT repeat protein
MEQAKQAELLEMLGSADPEERLTAIRVLGEAGDVQALEILRSWLKALSAEHTDDRPGSSILPRRKS